jgi:hypothetical protein
MEFRLHCLYSEVRQRLPRASRRSATLQRQFDRLVLTFAPHTRADRRDGVDGFARIPNWLTIDRGNDATALNAGSCGGAVGLSLGNNGAFGFFWANAVRDLRGTGSGTNPASADRAVSLSWPTTDFT